MTKLKVWISCGDSPWARTYFNEIGAVELTKEQIEKYFTFDEDGEIDFDTEVLSEAVQRNYDDPESDFPTWDTITDGCLGWGPDVDDQYVGVSLEDDDDTLVWHQKISELTYYSSEEIENNDPKENEEDGAIARIFYDLETSKDGVWVLYNSYERGGYSGELELPDGEEFDPSKLIVSLTEIAENWTIVSGIEYDNEEIYCEGDTIGKGIDWYIYYNDNLSSFM